MAFSHCRVEFVGLFHPTELALQFSAIAVALQRKGMCKYVHAAVTAHAPVTFSTLLNTELPAQCSWARTIFYPETTAKLAVTSFYSGRAHPNGFELPKPEQCLRIWRH